MSDFLLRTTASIKGRYIALIKPVCWNTVPPAGAVVAVYETQVTGDSIAVFAHVVGHSYDINGTLTVELDSIHADVAANLEINQQEHLDNFLGNSWLANK